VSNANGGKRHNHAAEQEGSDTVSTSLVGGDHETAIQIEHQNPSEQAQG